MVWGRGTFPSEGIGPMVRINGPVKANGYLNLVKQHAIPSLQVSPHQPTNFMQGNTPYHIAKCVKIFFEKTTLKSSVACTKSWNMWRVLGDKVKKLNSSSVNQFRGKNWKMNGKRWIQDLCERLVMSFDLVLFGFMAYQPL